MNATPDLMVAKRILFVAYAGAILTLGGLAGFWIGVRILPEYPLLFPLLLVVGGAIGHYGRHIWDWSQRD